MKHFNPIRPREGGGGARADFNFRELLCYLSNTYEMLPNLLENKILEKIFVKGITCCYGNLIFDAMFSQILTFKYFFFY